MLLTQMQSGFDCARSSLKRARLAIVTMLLSTFDGCFKHCWWVRAYNCAIWRPCTCFIRVQALIFSSYFFRVRGSLVYNQRSRSVASFEGLPTNVFDLLASHARALPVTYIRRSGEPHPPTQDRHGRCEIIH